MKHLFQRLAEHPGDTKRDLEARGIFALFDCGDCLTGDANLVTQIALRLPFGKILQNRR
jgi:hypothetical protein